MHADIIAEHKSEITIANRFMAFEYLIADSLSVALLKQ